MNNTMYGLAIIAILKTEIAMNNTMCSGASIASLDRVTTQWTTQCMYMESLQSLKDREYNEQHKV